MLVARTIYDPESLLVPRTSPPWERGRYLIRRSKIREMIYHNILLLGPGRGCRLLVFNLVSVFVWLCIGRTCLASNPPIQLETSWRMQQ